jgi:hypothetical protein
MGLHLQMFEVGWAVPADDLALLARTLPGIKKLSLPQ